MDAIKRLWWRRQRDLLPDDDADNAGLLPANNNAQNDATTSTKSGGTKVRARSKLHFFAQFLHQLLPKKLKRAKIMLYAYRCGLIPSLSEWEIDRVTSS